MTMRLTRRMTSSAGYLSQASNYTVQDTFNRTDSTSTLGTTTPTGQTWTAHTGTWGISSNQAYLVTQSGDSVATVDCTKSDIDMSCDVYVANTSTSQPGIVFRATDDRNYLLVMFNATGRLELWRRVTGTYTKLAEYNKGSVWSVGTYVTRVVTSGTSITVYLDGISRITQTTSQFQTNTRVGLRQNDTTAARYDNFTVV